MCLFFIKLKNVSQGSRLGRQGRHGEVGVVYVCVWWGELAERRSSIAAIAGAEQRKEKKGGHVLHSGRGQATRWGRRWGTTSQVDEWKGIAV